MRYDGASMASCPSCGAEGVPSGGSCPRCGARAAGSAAAPSLELDVPIRKAPKAAAPKKKPEEELSLELAIDPRSLVQPVVHEPSPESGARSRGGGPSSGAHGPLARRESASLAPRAAGAGELQVGDLGFDAHLLADYGDPPRHWLMSPLYAWRVIKRQREIKQALAGRREEATRAATELEDALVAFAERAKPLVEHNAAYADALAGARRAEETLRSRDAVLAADQDAHNARLASVEARLAKLEAELASLQSSERTIAAEIASSQGGLGRAESKLKRAESELRAAAREGIGTES
jgi:hypothetical protein